MKRFFKLKNIIKIFMLILLLIILTSIISTVIQYNINKDKIIYDLALANCEKYFYKNKDKFFNAANIILEKGKTEDIKIKKIEAINKYWSQNKIKIVFTLGSSGFIMTDQIWGIYYISDNTPSYFEHEIEIKYKSGPDGTYYSRYPGTRHMYITKYLEDNWYYFYINFASDLHNPEWSR